MKSIIKTRISGNSITISAEDVQFANSFGFELFWEETNENIEAEISRVEKDIKLLSVLEKTGIDEVILLIKKCDNPDKVLSGLKEKFDFSEDESLGILNMNLNQLTGIYFLKVIDRLKTYRNLLKSFLNE